MQIPKKPEPFLPDSDGDNVRADRAHEELSI